MDSENALQIVRMFNQALNDHDVDGMLALLTEDSVFENTAPAPDGTRYAGKAALRAFWSDFFRAARDQRIEIEEMFAVGERCVMRWTYHWRNASGQMSRVRGVDIYCLHGGLIAEKLSYVKG